MLLSWVDKDSESRAHTMGQQDLLWAQSRGLEQVRNLKGPLSSGTNSNQASDVRPSYRDRPSSAIPFMWSLHPHGAVLCVATPIVCSVSFAGAELVPPGYACWYSSSDLFDIRSLGRCPTPTYLQTRGHVGQGL